MIGQPPDLGEQPFGGRRVQVQAMVGGIARQHRRLHTQRNGSIDGITEATIGFDQVLRTVVQIGEMGEADHDALPREARCSSLSILSR